MTKPLRAGAGGEGNHHVCRHPGEGRDPWKHRSPDAAQRNPGMMSRAPRIPFHSIRATKLRLNDKEARRPGANRDPAPARTIMFAVIPAKAGIHGRGNVARSPDAAQRNPGMTPRAPRIPFHSIRATKLRYKATPGAR
jgi:hypothetical protein